MTTAQRKKIWKKRWYAALIAACFLRYIPYIRMIGLNGSLATGSFHQGSDIDFYIVSKPGRIYLTRFLSLGILQFLGLRRRKGHVSGKVCLNRFATTEFLEITPNDTYHAEVFHNLIPLYASVGVYENFIKSNRWMETMNVPQKVHQVYFRETLVTKVIQSFLELIFSPIASYFENLLEKKQAQRTTRDRRLQQGNNTIVLSRKELRFHLDKRYHE